VAKIVHPGSAGSHRAERKAKRSGGADAGRRERINNLAGSLIRGGNRWQGFAGDELVAV
jgi:hypothetical protein